MRILLTLMLEMLVRNFIDHQLVKNVKKSLSSWREIYEQITSESKSSSSNKSFIIPDFRAA